MPFKPGKPKTGGKVKGSKNKTTIGIDNRVDEICASVGSNPFLILAILSKDPDPTIALQAAKELCKYCKPQLKAIEISGNADKPLNSSLEILRSELKNKENDRE